MNVNFIIFSALKVKYQGQYESHSKVRRTKCRCNPKVQLCEIWLQSEKKCRKYFVIQFCYFADSDFLKIFRYDLLRYKILTKKSHDTKVQPFNNILSKFHHNIPYSYRVTTKTTLVTSLGRVRALNRNYI